MIKKYTQTTFETCLACCLFLLVDRIKSIKISKNLELNCIIHSMKFSKEDFEIGHFDFVVKKFNVNILRIIDNIRFFKYVKKLKVVSGVKTIVEKINLNLINKLLKKSIFTIYIDAYYLYKVYHYPHFIIILSVSEQKYKIFDPWNGKEKLIDKKILSKAIQSLRNHLKFCPQIIIVN